MYTIDTSIYGRKKNPSQKRETKLFVVIFIKLSFIKKAIESFGVDILLNM